MTIDFATRLPDLRPSSPPEGPDVSGMVEIELDGITYRLVLPSVDDSVEVFEVSTAEETLYWGGRSFSHPALRACARFLESLASDQRERLERQLYELAVEKLRRGEVLS